MRKLVSRGCLVLAVVVAAMAPLLHLLARGELTYAAETGQYSKVRLLLKLDPFVVNAIGPDDLTHTPAISLAIEKKRWAIVRLLVARGADINLANSGYGHGSAPLHVAARFADADITRLLIEKGAHVNAQDLYGKTALHFAARRGRMDIVRLLIESKANPIIRSRDGLLPVDEALHGGHADALGVLRKYGTVQMPRIHVAASLGDLETVVEETRRDPGLVNANYHDWRPLHLAAMHGHVRVVQHLLTHGADTEALWRDQTPLYIAVAAGNLAIVRSLVEGGADLNIMCDGMTPLDQAVVDKNIMLVKYLVEHGAEVDLREEGSYTPLHTAVLSNRLEIVSYLVQNGADVSANGLGVTPLQLAEDQVAEGLGNPAVVRYLRKVSSDK